MRGKFRRQERATSWRRIAVNTWEGPADPSVYGLLEVDVSHAFAYIRGLREQTGVHVTLTHLVGKAVAEAIRERPEINAIIRRGRRFYVRDTVDIFFQVAFEGGENLSGSKVQRADHKSPVAIAEELQQAAERVRQKRDRELGRTHTLLSRAPSWMRRPMIRTANLLTYDLGLDLRRLGIPYDQFGSAMVTNVGSFDIPAGFAPLVPFSHCPIVLSIGAVQHKPVAVDGGVEVRPVVTFGATLDHRVLDGYQAGRLARRFREVMSDPARALRSVPDPFAVAEKPTSAE